MKLLRIRILLSDPWDLGESINWQPILGELKKLQIDEAGGRALVAFDTPISYRGTSYRFAVAVPRHSGKSLDAVASGGKVDCSFTAVSEEHAGSEAALSTDHWRGGLAFIGELEATQ